jgi:hypothetical protein
MRNGYNNNILNNRVMGASYGRQRAESLVTGKYLFYVLMLQGNERKHNECLPQTLRKGIVSFPSTNVVNKTTQCAVTTK